MKNLNLFRTVFFLAFAQVIFGCSTGRYYDFGAANSRHHSAYHKATAQAAAATPDDALAAAEAPEADAQPVLEASADAAPAIAPVAPVVSLKQKARPAAPAAPEVAATADVSAEVPVVAPAAPESVEKVKAKKKLFGLFQKPAVVGTVLLVILSFLLPPLAVFLKRGISGAFWLNLLLTLLFWLPGVIHALIVVLAG